MQKIYNSNLFLIAGIIVLGAGAAQFYQLVIKPRFISKGDTD